MAQEQQSFIWYELMTTDLPAAERFYTAVVGWTAENFNGASMEYIVVKSGESGVGGLMTVPDPSIAPAWAGYVYAPDTDTAVASLEKAGGSIHREPFDVPSVGRMAVVADPQGVMFNVMTPQPPPGAEPPKVDPMGAGQVGWRELFTTDWEKAFEFYAGQFGWTKGEAMDMGEMGIYQLFNSGADQMGGMMNKTPDQPVPYWLFYFNVGDIDEAIERVKSNRGTVLMGPMQVPGDAWIIQCLDPQGAAFALVGSKA